MLCLQITSVLFSTITIHAYCKKTFDIFLLSLLLALFNLWHNCAQHTVIQWINKFISTYYFFYMSLELLLMQSPLILCAPIILFTYYNYEIAYNQQLKLKWHVILHCHVIACSHFYLGWFIRR
jgi:hypothetical protein